MMRSGLKVPTLAIPMPDFAVPYAAPIPAYPFSIPSHSVLFSGIHPNIMAKAMPAMPRKGANLGVNSTDDMAAGPAGKENRLVRISTIWWMVARLSEGTCKVNDDLTVVVSAQAELHGQTRLEPDT